MHGLLFIFFYSLHRTHTIRLVCDFEEKNGQKMYARGKNDSNKNI